ncbi:hypothetical protein M1567_00990 [Candidatus Marsarchaeota archaeon]|jgi:hypothetical protein|nr:hypothetical protein [Candidatus Marsarchaeota archaeon]
MFPSFTTTYSPYGVIHIAPLCKNGDLGELEKRIYDITEGIEIESSIIVDITKTWIYENYYKANRKRKIEIY